VSGEFAERIALDEDRNQDIIDKITEKVELL